MMKDLLPMTLDEFNNALEVYGAQLSRMPQPLASKAIDLIAKDPTAKLLFEEATALDKALDQSEVTIEKVISTFDLKAIENKILASVEEKTIVKALAEPANTVINFNKKAIAKERKKLNEPANDNFIEKYLVPGLLAASLIFGLVFGSLGGADTILNETLNIEVASTDMADDILYLDQGYFHDDGQTE